MLLVSSLTVRSCPQVAKPGFRHQLPPSASRCGERFRPAFSPVYSPAAAHGSALRSGARKRRARAGPQVCVCVCVLSLHGKQRCVREHFLLFCLNCNSNSGIFVNKGERVINELLYECVYLQLPSSPPSQPVSFSRKWKAPRLQSRLFPGF